MFFDQQYSCRGSRPGTSHAQPGPHRCPDSDASSLRSSPCGQKIAKGVTSVTLPTGDVCLRRDLHLGRRDDVPGPVAYLKGEDLADVVGVPETEVP